MLVLLRIVFGAALLYQIMEAVRSPPGSSEAGDTTGAFYLAVCVILGVLNALVWAPYFGEKLSGPLTSVMTGSTYVERTNWLLRLIRWLDARGFRSIVRWFCFWEGVRHPDAPSAFVVGLKNAGPGSWLEKIFAREVFRFNNTQHCVQAYLALRRHGLDPRPHPSQEVNIMLLSLDRPVRSEPARLNVPEAAKPAPLKRNPGIHLFGGIGAAGREEETLAERVGGEPPPGSDIAGAPGNDVKPEPGSTRGLSKPGGTSDMLARIVAFLRVS